MKRTIQILALFLITCIFQNAHAQDTDFEELGNNEVKLNLLYGVFEIIEVHYERILSDNIGLGFSGSYFFDQDTDIRGLALPYFRFYPSGSSRAEGFFIEANSGVVVTEQFTFEEPSIGFGQPSSQGFDETLVSFGFGVAIGGKFVTRSGVFGEAYGGVGRIYNQDDFVEFYPRFGLNMGYRF
jgi:hypothetical protein